MEKLSLLLRMILVIFQLIVLTMSMKFNRYLHFSLLQIQSWTQRQPVMTDSSFSQLKIQSIGLILPTYLPYKLILFLMIQEQAIILWNFIFLTPRLIGLLLPYFRMEVILSNLGVLITWHLSTNSNIILLKQTWL